MEELQKKEWKPSKEIEDKFFEVLQFVKDGYSVQKGCDAIGMGKDTFYKCVNNVSELANEYVCACEVRAYGMVEESCAIFDTIEPIIIVNGREEQNNIGLQIAKAKAENLKWHASKLNKVFADKGVQVNTQINTNQPVQIVQPTNINQDINRLLGDSLQNDTKIDD